MPWDQAPRLQVLRTLTWLMSALCKVTVRMIKQKT